MEWSKNQYNKQYENWMPWIEDQYLYYFGKDNKASYATKDTLSKSKVTGISQVDQLQDSVNDTAASTIGKGGLAQPLGDAASREGVNRAERGGKDDGGGYLPDAVPGKGGVEAAGGKLADGAKGAGGYVGGVFGAGGQGEKK